MRALALAMGVMACCGTAAAADLTVKLGGIKSADGKVVVQLFSAADAAAFPDGKPTQEQQIAADTAGVTATFSGLAAGDYAVGAFHDANGNGKLDANFMGMPTEDVGNSGEKALAKPGFEKSKLTLGDGATEISIILR